MTLCKRILFRQQFDRRAQLCIAGFRPGETRISWLPSAAKTAADDAEFVGSVEYKPNTLAAFINSGTSLHGVSPRAPSTISRRLVNIIGRVHQSVPEGLFARPQKPGFGAMHARMRERVGDRLNRRRNLHLFQ